MQDLVYACPETIEDAVAAMAAGDTRALAGGTDLIAQLREGRRRVARVVDLKRIPALTTVVQTAEGGVTIGAAVNATVVSRHAAIVRAYPAIAESARLIGGVQIQNRASLGGNVCNAAPSADAVPALVCHDACALIAGSQGQRKLPVEQLFKGPGRTVLKADEILVCLELPPPQPSSAAKYLRFTPRREMDIAIAGAGAWIRLTPDGTITGARIALASVAPTPVRAPSAEQRLMGERPSRGLFEEAGRLAAADAQPISDTRASADYRRTLVGVLTARSLAGCCDQLQVEVGA